MYNTLTNTQVEIGFGGGPFSLFLTINVKMYNDSRPLSGHEILFVKHDTKSCPCFCEESIRGGPSVRWLLFLRLPNAYGSTWCAEGPYSVTALSAAALFCVDRHFVQHRLCKSFLSVTLVAVV